MLGFSLLIGYQRLVTDVRGTRVSTSSPASGALPPLDISYEDDPKVVEKAATENFSLRGVPRTWRSTASSWRWWWAVMTAFFYLYFAAFLALADGTVDADRDLRCR